MSKFSIRSHLMETAFCVSLLNKGGQPEEFSNWYAYCQFLVESFLNGLKQDGYSDSEAEQLSYAQCALLDEMALKYLGYPDRDEWEKKPLQVHYFQNYHAGEIVCDRIETLVRESQPNSVLTEGYLSILGLGFRGRYISDELMYQQQKNQLSNHFKQLLHNGKIYFQESYPQEFTEGKIIWLGKDGVNKFSQNWRLSAPMICILLISLTVVIYFFLNYYLDTQIQLLKI